jgi:PTH2 family peptidyl-tRNA hydrolase
MDINNSREEQYNMYVLVNTDLKMTKGKIASQVGHVVGCITEEIIRKSYESDTINKDYISYMNWKNSGSAKIILKASQNEITKFIEKPKTIHIIDEGRTQIEPNSLTVLGFYPSNTLSNELKDFKLL